jgi:hypothetical protein
LETIIFLPAVPAIAPALPPVIEPAEPPAPIWFGKKSAFLRVRLTSGVTLEIAAVKLFQEAALYDVAAAKNAALAKMGGVSTGLGAIGSLSWVLMATSVIGMVESHLSNAAAEQGRGLLHAVAVRELKIRQCGEFFPVGLIDQIEQPLPGLWRVPPQPCYPTGFIHTGDDFLTVRDAAGTILSVRWGAVEEYRCLEQAEVSP